ncbi:MAG TPA: 4Fe-4S dicluster domain-containing protein, partial [Limnochorda sp.]
MDLTRRQLFQWGARLGAAGAAAVWAFNQGRPVQAESASPSSSQKGMLIDITKCVGCRRCERACREKWGLDQDQIPFTWLTKVSLPGKTRYTRHQCFHCLDPACVSACPVAALRKTAEGAVMYEEGRCLGCRYCMLACPFQIPRYEWSSWNPAVTKCVFCYDRLAQGEAPACAVACPTGATLFGDREELLAE